jgi:hypothetical protein
MSPAPSTAAKAQWKARVGFVMCLVGLAIASVELAYFATASIGGDIPFGPLFSILFLPFTLLGLILAHVARVQIRRSGEEPRGARLARAALIMGYLVFPTIFISAQVAHQSLRGGVAPAVGSLRTIATAEIVYSETFKHGFSRTLPSLGPPPPGLNPSPDYADLVDGVLASGAKSGYTFRYTARDTHGDGTLDAYTVQADPIDPSRGGRHFFMDQSAVIRSEARKPATLESPPIQ